MKQHSFFQQLPLPLPLLVFFGIATVYTIAGPWFDWPGSKIALGITIAYCVCSFTDWVCRKNKRT